jgi:hypothetical protein
MNPLLLLPLAVVVLYVTLRKFSGRKRKKRTKELGAAKALFAEMDIDGSGEISREELREAVTLLVGEDATLETIASLVDAIDIDHNGSVNEHEFVAWLEHNTTRLKVSSLVRRLIDVLYQPQCMYSPRSYDILCRLRQWWRRSFLDSAKF